MLRYPHRAPRSEKKSIHFRAVTPSGEMHQELYNHNKRESVVAFAQVVSPTLYGRVGFSIAFPNGKITLKCENTNAHARTQHALAKLPFLSP